jgi:hypothetical protein
VPVPEGGLGLVPGELCVAAQQRVGVQSTQWWDRAAEPGRGGGEQGPQGGAARTWWMSSRNAIRTGAGSQYGA